MGITHHLVIYNEKWMCYLRAYDVNLKSRRSTTYQRQHWLHDSALTITFKNTGYRRWAGSSSQGSTKSIPLAVRASGYTELLVNQHVPVIPTLRYPSSTATAAATSAICSHGNGDFGFTKAKAWWMVLSGHIKKSAPAVDVVFDFLWVKIRLTSYEHDPQDHLP